MYLVVKNAPVFGPALTQVLFCLHFYIFKITASSELVTKLGDFYGIGYVNTHKKIQS